jgi:hypothetical protein
MATPPAPARPDEAGSQRRVERRWLPLLAVLAAIALVTGGGRSVSEALAGDEPPPVDVGSAVTVQPAPGWSVERVEDGDGVDAVLLSRGSAVLQVTAVETGPRPPVLIFQEYTRAVLAETYDPLTVGEAEGASVGGVPAVEAGYVGTTDGGVTVEGFVVVAAAPSGSEVAFDAAAPAGDLAWAVEDLVAMISTAELR